VTWKEAPRILMAALLGICRTACLSLAMVAAAAWGQSSPLDADIAAKCPEAVREAAELRNRTRPGPVPAIVSRPALRHNLLLMAKHDQEARAFLRSTGSRIDPATPEGVRLREVDSANLKRLKHIVAQDGFPTAEMVGLDGVDAAWTLTIHAAADPDFREKVLEMTAAHVRRGEVRGDQVATLTDDVLRGRGKKQRYGTEFEIHDGELRPFPIEDEGKVDERRRAVGLGTLANYTCFIRALYGVPAAKL
jgi:hypothetical protein